MDEELLEHIRSLCRLMREAGLTELDADWRESRIFLRSERGAREAARSVRPPAPAAPRSEPGLIEIRSPLLGTFYRSPAPDRPTFVEVGDLVEEGQTVAVVEAMKIINDITAEAGGRVAEVCAENGELVKEGDVLMRLTPA